MMIVPSVLIPPSSPSCNTCGVLALHDVISSQVHSSSDMGPGDQKLSTSLTLWTSAVILHAPPIPASAAAPIPSSPRFVASCPQGKILCFKSPQDSPILDDALSLYWSTFSSSGVDVPPFMARALLDYGVYRVYVVVNDASHVLAVALVVQMVDLNTFHLDYICTDPSCRGNGLGSSFFKGIVSDLQCDCPVYQFMSLQCQNHLLNWYLKIMPKGALKIDELDDIVSPTVTFHFVVAPLMNFDHVEKKTKEEKGDAVFKRLNETIWSKALEANKMVTNDKVDHGLESRQEMCRFLGLCSGKDNH